MVKEKKFRANLPGRKHKFVTKCLVIYCFKSGETS